MVHLPPPPPKKKAREDDGASCIMDFLLGPKPPNLDGLSFRAGFPASLLWAA